MAMAEDGGGRSRLGRGLAYTDKAVVLGLQRPCLRAELSGIA